MATIIALVVGAAALVAYGFVSMSSSETAEPAPPPTDTAATSPLLVPIEDAREVVADINDNSSAAELLEELGLDASGNPLADAEPTPGTTVAPAGHRFTWSYGTGDAATVTVDSTTGNFSFESSTGSHYRLVDGASFVRASEAALWSRVDGDSLQMIQPLGLEQPMTVDDITNGLESIASEATSSFDDGTAFVSISIDDVQFAEQIPEARIAWLAVMGIPNPDTLPADGSLIAADADIAADGKTITSLTVTAGPWISTYQLEELFDVAPLIETP